MRRDELVEGFTGFPDRLGPAAQAAADRPVAAGEWGPSEIARHLIAVEREVWWTRFASIVEEDEPQWSWMEPGLEPGLDGVPLAEILSRFAAARARSVSILAGFDEAAWARTGVHATFGRLDAVGLLGIVTDHDAEHLASLGDEEPGAIDASSAPSYTQSRRNHSDIEDVPLTATTKAIEQVTPTLPTQRPAYHGSGAIAFSTKGEYGVRLMVQLGRHVGTGPASLAEIAAEEDLPRAYLEQLVVSLREAGLVTSTRGAHGGYELARPPETISMAEVLRALEGPIAPMMCASDDPEHATLCDRSARCTVNVLWVRVRDAVAGALDSMTLADLVPPRIPEPAAPTPIQPTPLQGALTNS